MMEETCNNLFNIGSTYNSYEELVEDFKSERLHPGDLKTALSIYIDRLIEPVRRHFQTDSNAKKILE